MAVGYTWLISRWEAYILILSKFDMHMLFMGYYAPGLLFDSNSPPTLQAETTQTPRHAVAVTNCSYKACWNPKITFIRYNTAKPGIEPKAIDN